MSPVTRDRLLLGCGLALLVAGMVAWWWLPARKLYDAGYGTGYGPMLALWFAAAGLAAAAWRVTTRPGTDESRIFAALSLASTAPLSAVPLVASDGSRTVPLALAAAAVAVLPLGLTLAGYIRDSRHARRVTVLVVGCVFAAVAETWLGSSGESRVAAAVRWLLLAIAVVVPATLAAGSVLRGPRPASGAQLRILVALGLCAAGIVPAVTGAALLIPEWQVLVIPTVIAVVTAAVLARVAVRPLAHLAGSAVAQLYLVVAETEAERIRLATALHDGPLGDISLLVQRLDQSGDADGAAIARAIASDLRAIGGDLRLPILDDLGAGPAIEWLVGRVCRRAGAEVRLELETIARPPAPVELAVYRVAQEALVNAVKHGRPPVTVRYIADRDAVSLTVDDAGPGIDRGASERAQREGRLGLVSMAQRAEAIGAELVLAARASGGTHVGLTWKPAAA